MQIANDVQFRRYVVPGYTLLPDGEPLTFVVSPLVPRSLEDLTQAAEGFAYRRLEIHPDERAIALRERHRWPWDCAYCAYTNHGQVREYIRVRYSREDEQAKCLTAVLLEMARWARQRWPGILIPEFTAAELATPPVVYVETARRPDNDLPPAA